MNDSNSNQASFVNMRGGSGQNDFDKSFANQMMCSGKQIVLKVILLGDSSVGKTSIINQYVKKIFSDNLKPTIGVDFANQVIKKDDLKSRSTSCDGGTRYAQGQYLEESIMLQIWDTMGQEMFKSINRMYYRGVHGVVLVCDLYQTVSLNHLNQWLQEFLQKQDRSANYSDFAFVLLANKCDKTEPPLISEEEIISWCEKQREACYRKRQNWRRNQ
eukprot:403368408